ncbi:MAG: hypothetical protein JSW14_04380 [Candidatus Bathyarchaeum sp.]|nr:MAG: hypothetical protein JSW14_04380 [Candidatus Bathyarchaeum sp.]
MTSESTEALSKGIDTSIKNPILFIPALVPIIIHVLFLILAYAVSNTWLVWGGQFIASILGFFAYCMIVDMANDGINGQPIDLNKSMNVVTGRLGTLILAAIIFAVFAITFILIPVALFIITIAIVEKTDAIKSTTKSFDFVIKNLGEVIVFLIIVIVVWIVLGIGFALIPVVGAYLGSVFSWLLNVVLIIAAVHFYLSLRPQPPPPPTQD